MALEQGGAAAAVHVSGDVLEDMVLIIRELLSKVNTEDLRVGKSAWLQLKRLGFPLKSMTRVSHPMMSGLVRWNKLERIGLVVVLRNFRSIDCDWSTGFIIGAVDLSLFWGEPVEEP